MIGRKPLAGDEGGGDDQVGGATSSLPNCTSSTECSSMPLGATPVWPCRKSKKPTPVIVTGTLAVLNELVVYLVVNSERGFLCPIGRPSSCACPP